MEELSSLLTELGDFRGMVHVLEDQILRGKDPAAKERILWRLADLMERDKEQLAMLESLENGKTLREALRGDVNPGIDALRQRVETRFTLDRMIREYRDAYYRAAGARRAEPAARSPQPGARSPERGARSPEPGA